MGANYETIKYLLEQGAEDEKMWELACMEETGDLIEFLVKEGYEPTGMDVYNALVHGSDRVFEEIIEMGFSIDGTDEEIPVDGVYTDERMLILLQKGAAITEDTLSHAVDLRAYDVMDFILRSNGNIGQEMALTDAISMGDFTAVKKIVNHGGDCTIKDSNGKTPYKWAKEVGSKENMRLLLRM